MWKIIEEKGLTENANEVEVYREKPKRHERKKKSPFWLVSTTDLVTDETKYFPSLTPAAIFYGKCYTYFT